MKTLYTLGFQPIDIVSKDYQLIDVVNLALSGSNPISVLPNSIISTLKSLKFNKEDVLFVNSQKSRAFLPYCLVQNTILYDPPYIPNERETYKLFKELVKFVGGPNSLQTYNTSANSARAILTQRRHELQPSIYFNALVLLTDLNHSDTVAYEKYILEAPTYQYEVQHKAIYFGDPIRETFFDNLAQKKVAIVSYLPYEFFCLPINEPVLFYTDTSYFYPMNSVLSDLKRIIREREANILILNPRDLYLTGAEARYIAEELGNTITTYILPDSYEGVDIDVSLLPKPV